MQPRNILKNYFIATILLGGSNLSYGVNFSLLSDIHVTPGNENETQLLKAIEEINTNDSEFVILSGDLTNEGSDQQLYNVKKILGNLDKPIYVIPGNHEDTWSQSALKSFNDIWGNDRFVFETDNYVFIGINCGPYMKMGDGHIKHEDLRWLELELASRCTDGKRVISINHYPIKDDLDNWQDYINVLQKYPTVVHICGHYHNYDKYKGGDIDGVICRALDQTKRGWGYGYSNITLSDDSIFIYNKEIGKPQNLQFKFAQRTKHPKYKFSDDKNSSIPAGYCIKRIFQDEASIFTRVAVDEECVYFGNSLGEVKAVTISDSSVKWKFHTDASLFSRPAINDNYIIIPTADKRIIWADKSSGRCIRENLSEGPYVADGLVVDGLLFQGGYKKFECWNAKTGNLCWRNTDFENYCQAEPVVDGNDVIFGAWDTYLRCLDRKTGELKWKWNNGKPANMLGPGNCVPAVNADRVCIVAPDRYITILDRTSGKEIWRSNFDGKYKVRESLGLSDDGKTAFAKTMDGQLIAVDINKDEENICFAVDAGLGYEHAPCIVAQCDGIVYLGSRRGIIVAIDPEKQKVLWSYRLGTSEVNGFEKANGKLYASLTEGCIWEISKNK